MHDVPSNILTAAQDGDHGAFRVIVHTYSPRLHAVIRRMIRDTDTERDILQEVFTKAFLQLPRFRGDASLGTWLHRIAYTTSLNHLRSIQRAPRHEELNEEEFVSVHATLFDDMDGEHIRTVLREQVENLPPVYAVVIDLFYVQECKYEQIATITGAPIGTVKARLNRGRKMLRDAVMSKLGGYESY
ncbi:MAG: RNA polymerase sigma factor [Candidatus Kapaibacterium sp.]